MPGSWNTLLASPRPMVPRGADLDVLHADERADWCHPRAAASGRPLLPDLLADGVDADRTHRDSGAGRGSATTNSMPGPTSWRDY